MIDFRLVSCLEKVFCDRAPQALAHAPEGLIGEKAAFQAAWSETEATPEKMRAYARLEIDSPISEHIRVYAVRQVPVRFPSLLNSDPNYLNDKRPGLYPDALEEIKRERLRIFAGQWEAVWVEIDARDELPAGEYPIILKLISQAEAEAVELRTVYRRIDARLPQQSLVHTRWFHTDGLCSYYGVRMFSERFWSICRKFIKAAADMSVNCLLTPIHTPPLDTAVGGERLTCQLVDIEKYNHDYRFGFQKLERWIRMAQECGIEYFEMAHLFSQWGAACAPKIVARVNGRIKRIFGWDTPGTGVEYLNFLNQYLPALRAELERLGVLERCLFHISDEPSLNHLDNYMKARKSVETALKGLTVIDALSNIELYEQGAVEHPVPATNHIRPFLDAHIKDLWCYYCISQHDRVSNAFIAMPSARTRIIGVQMYKYDIAGFLHWGFNFYNSQYSEYALNPFLNTDGDGFAPAGDAFIVYPGEDGKPLHTLRSKVFEQAVQDMRALKLLESLSDKQFVMRIVEDGIAPIEFDVYPAEADYIINLRQRINAEIAKRV